MSADGLIIATYSFAAASAAWRSTRFLWTGEPHNGLVWLACAAVLLALAALKGSDAGPVLVGALRERVVSGGWYGQRRLFQSIAVTLTASTLALVAWFVASQLRVRGIRTPAAGLGLGALLIWVSVRASSLHVADKYMGAALGPLNVSQLGELTLLLWIIGCALYVVRVSTDSKL
jgi:hypothetical protein